MKPNRRETISLLASAAPAVLGMLSAVGATSSAQAQETKPNILFILTDDQDTQSMPFMPKVKSLLADQGVTFTRNFVATSLCCPSRASILTGPPCAATLATAPGRHLPAREHQAVRRRPRVCPCQAQPTAPVAHPKKNAG